MFNKQQMDFHDLRCPNRIYPNRGRAFFPIHHLKNGGQLVTAHKVKTQLYRNFHGNWR